MEKSQKVTIFSIILLVGFTIGVFYHYIVGFYMHHGEPYNSFLYPSDMAFCDLLQILPYIKNFEPYKHVTMWVVYFPLNYIFMMPFTLIKNQVLTYLVYQSLFMAYLTHMNIKNFSCKNLGKLQNFQNIFICTMLAYPVLYCLDKGNFDIYLFIFLGCWTYAFLQGKYGLSAVWLALINACKPFMVYFLIFYLIKKRYKEFFLNIFLTGFLVLGGFFVFKGELAEKLFYLTKSLAFYKYNYAVTDYVAFGFCSSLFVPLKVIMLHVSTAHKDVMMFVKNYDIVCNILTFLTFIFVWREKTFWKQLSLLIFNFLLFPYMTYDYKFIFLFIPIWLFVNSEEKSKFDLAYLILFASLFVPKSIIVIFPLIKNNYFNWTTLSAIINPVIMIIFCLLIIFEQFYNQKKDKEA